MKSAPGSPQSMKPRITSALANIESTTAIQHRSHVITIWSISLFLSGKLTVSDFCSDQDISF